MRVDALIDQGIPEKGFLLYARALAELGFEVGDAHAHRFHQHKGMIYKVGGFVDETVAVATDGS